MKFIKSVKAFFRTVPVESTSLVSPDAFMGASDGYQIAYNAAEPYTIRAHHRYTISEARAVLFSAQPDDHRAADAYDAAVAGFTDPDDFKPFIEIELDAHSDAIDKLTAAFDDLSAAFDAFNPADRLYTSTVALYRAIYNTYEFSLIAYDHAADCAMLTALEAGVQTIKEEFELLLIETRATRAIGDDAEGVRAEAAKFKIKVTADTAKAKSLEQKAHVAKAKAELLLAKAMQIDTKLNTPTE